MNEPTGTTHKHRALRVLGVFAGLVLLAVAQNIPNPALRALALFGAAVLILLGLANAITDLIRVIRAGTNGQK
jgi:hypothetical protein